MSLDRILNLNGESAESALHGTVVCRGSFVTRCPVDVLHKDGSWLSFQQKLQSSRHTLYYSSMFGLHGILIWWISSSTICHLISQTVISKSKMFGYLNNSINRLTRWRLVVSFSSLSSTLKEVFKDMVKDPGVLLSDSAFQRHFWSEDRIWCYFWSCANFLATSDEWHSLGTCWDFFIAQFMLLLIWLLPMLHLFSCFVHVFFCREETWRNIRYKGWTIMLDP